MSIRELVAKALEQEDPAGWLRVMAPPAVERQEVIATTRMSTLEVPVADYPEGGHLPRHVQLHTRGKEQIGLRRLLEGLDLSQARLADGKRVVNYPSAVRWILEQLGQ